MPRRFQVGQRWVSESEPELGIGSVQQFTDQTVTLVFPARDETRRYALESAPLRRVQFRVGDAVQPRDGKALPVERVVERNGLLVYGSGQQEVAETELSYQLRLGRPEDRLRHGQVDPTEAFDLRCDALQYQARRRQSEVRGVTGGRIELIPHQLFIAQEVTQRLVPRVLLADEVGLGKTIEACLILHRLLQTGRVQRVLILVPEPLIHQWFVELLRRFNLWFRILDVSGDNPAGGSGAELNLFLEDQLVLGAVNVMAKSERLTRDALAAGWDLLVVDEAHHLSWTPELISPEYAFVEKLALRTPGLLLLTATPEQLGMTSHFARLRLLDPERYYDLEAFLEETTHYEAIAAIAGKLLSRHNLTPSDPETLAHILHQDPAQLRTQMAKILSGDTAVGQHLIDQLVDRHGTGRVMFRNTRSVMSGFPKRVPHLYPLTADGAGDERFTQLAQEFAADSDARVAAEFEPDLIQDPRVAWLAQFLRERKGEKVLLICGSPSKVQAIEESLRRKLQVKTALFYEGLPLVQRDRQAAWFAEPDGAQILLASEIGSEGRNFQFAHHLILFDLPLDPELLEQRIGRLDRIGQRSEIHIHVPYVRGSSQEVLARWFHEGLNAFEHNLRGGRDLLERFGPRVHDLAQDFHETQESTRHDLQLLIEQTRLASHELAARLEKGRDRLLELNSNRPEAAQRIIQLIVQQDRDRSLEDFLLAIFDQNTIHYEELAPRTYHLGSAGVFTDSFPGLPASGVTLTLDRQQALAREDIQFLTWDHPLATGALDLILGSDFGTSSFALWPDPGAAGLYLEAIYQLECLAPARLQTDRFLPPTPLRVLVDHSGADATSAVSPALLVRVLKTAHPYPLLDRPEIREGLLRELVAKAEQLAAAQLPSILQRAQARMHAQLDREIGRLQELHKVNRNVRDQELELLASQRQELDRHIAAAQLRLDAVRFIQRGPC